MSDTLTDFQREPSERESFDNFLDHKTDLEEIYSISLNTTNRIIIYKAVIDDLKKRNLINKEFYENELETISFLEDDTYIFKNRLYMLINVYIIILYVIFSIILIGYFKNLVLHSFNITHYEL